MPTLINIESSKDQERKKKEIAKAYGRYAKQFTPRPNYVGNCLKAFITGGAICTLALAAQNSLTGIWKNAIEGSGCPPFSAVNLSLWDLYHPIWLWRMKS